MLRFSFQQKNGPNLVRRDSFSQIFTLKSGMKGHFWHRFWAQNRHRFPCGSKNRHRFQNRHRFSMVIRVGGTAFSLHEEAPGAARLGRLANVNKCRGVSRILGLPGKEYTRSQQISSLFSFTSARDCCSCCPKKDSNLQLTSDACFINPLSAVDNEDSNLQLTSDACFINPLSAMDNDVEYRDSGRIKLGLESSQTLDFCRI